MINEFRRLTISWNESSITHNRIYLSNCMKRKRFVRHSMWKKKKQRNSTQNEERMKRKSVWCVCVQQKRCCAKKPSRRSRMWLWRKIQEFGLAHWYYHSVILTQLIILVDDCASTLAYSFSPFHHFLSLSCAPIPFVSYAVLHCLFIHSFIPFIFPFIFFSLHFFPIWNAYNECANVEWWFFELSGCPYKSQSHSLRFHSANLRCACRIVIHSVRCHVNATDYRCNEIAKTTFKSNRKMNDGSNDFDMLARRPSPVARERETERYFFYSLCIFCRFCRNLPFLFAPSIYLLSKMLYSFS